MPQGSADAVVREMLISVAPACGLSPAEVELLSVRRCTSEEQRAFATALSCLAGKHVVAAAATDIIVVKVRGQLRRLEVDVQAESCFDDLRRALSTPV